MARQGRRGRDHRRIQCAVGRPAAVVPLPDQAVDGVRSGHLRARRCHEVSPRLTGTKNPPRIPQEAVKAPVGKSSQRETTDRTRRGTEMSVQSVTVNNVYPHSDSRYENVEATVAFAVNPDALANQRIVDLELAPRDEDGLVRYDADLRLMRPVGGGNGKLLFVVPNRGIPTNAPWLKGGFLLDRGWTIASCGWQWDV